MLTPIFWLLLLHQDTISRVGDFFVIEHAKTQTIEEAERRVNEQEIRLLEHRFDKLADALRQFAAEYNKTQGNVWPLKQAEAVRKASRDLDRSMSLKRQPTIY